MLRRFQYLLQGRELVKKEKIDYNIAVIMLKGLQLDSPIDIRFNHSEYLGVVERAEHKKGVSPLEAISHLSTNYNNLSPECTVIHKVFRGKDGKETHYLEIKAMPNLDSNPILRSRLEYCVFG